jgi:hypothetical protein
LDQISIIWVMKFEAASSSIAPANLAVISSGQIVIPGSGGQGPNFGTELQFKGLTGPKASELRANRARFMTMSCKSPVPSGRILLRTAAFSRQLVFRGFGAMSDPRNTTVSQLRAPRRGDPFLSALLHICPWLQTSLKQRFELSESV